MLGDLLEGAPGRFYSLRLSIRTWLDHDAFHASLPRFVKNPMVADFLRRERHQRQQGQEDEVRKVWYLPPWHAREEVYEGSTGTLVEVNGNVGDREWQWVAGDPPRFTERPASPGVAALVPKGNRAPAEAMPPLGILFHPMVSELLEPSDVIGPLSFHEEGYGRHLNRPVIKTRAHLRDWEHCDAFSFEDFPIADEYNVLVDAERGFLLRTGCRTEGVEFTFTEVLDITFDQPIPPETFEPPSFRLPPGSHPI